MIQILNNQYQYDTEIDLLDVGGFSKVYRAVNIHNHLTVALKIGSAEQSSHKYSLLEESKKALHFDHPNLVKYHDFFTLEVGDGLTGTNLYQVIAMEFINGGDLVNYYRKVQQDSDLLHQIVLGILDGLAYLHQNGIIHRDIKPKNILIQKHGNKIIPKITDFGISKDLNDKGSEVSQIIPGSPQYMSPQQIASSELNYQADIWAFGILFFEILTEKSLFGTGPTYNTEQIRHNVLNNKYAYSFDLIPEYLRNIIQKCIAPKLESRYQNVAEIKTDLGRCISNISPKGQQNYDGRTQIFGGGTSNLGNSSDNFEGKTNVFAKQKIDQKPIVEPSVKPEKLINSYQPTQADIHSGNSTNYVPPVIPEPIPAPTPITQSKPPKNNTVKYVSIALILVVLLVVAGFFYTQESEKKDKELADEKVKLDSLKNISDSIRVKDSIDKLKPDPKPNPNPPVIRVPAPVGIDDFLQNINNASIAHESRKLWQTDFKKLFVRNGAQIIEKENTTVVRVFTINEFFAEALTDEGASFEIINQEEENGKIKYLYIDIKR